MLGQFLASLDSCAVHFLIKRNLKIMGANSANNLVRWGAMDAAELLERARYYRSLADQADEQIRAELLFLAEQYEARAAKWSSGGKGRPMTIPTDGLPTAARGWDFGS